MCNHLHLLMKRRMSWKNAETFSGRNGWVANLVTWCGSSSSVNRGMKPWTGVGESGASQRFPERIRYHIWVEKNAPCMRPHLRRKLVMIFDSGVKRESSN